MITLPTAQELAENLTIEEISAFGKQVENAKWLRRQHERQAIEAAAAEALANSPERRFKAAVRDLRRAGVKWHTNVKKCCRSCVTGQELGLTGDNDLTTKYGWTYGSQGCNIRWDAQGQPEKEMSRSRWEIPSHDPISVYAYHGNGAGQLIADTFRQHGFQVDWDGSDVKAVEVVL